MGTLGYRGMPGDNWGSWGDRDLGVVGTLRYKGMLGTIGTLG